MKGLGATHMALHSSEDYFLTDKQVHKHNKKFKMEVPEGELIQEELLISGWEQCPLCPGHLDESDSFEWYQLLNTKVCKACTYEIHNGLINWPERPTSDRYSHAVTIERIEQLTGLTFQQLKYQHLREKIVEWSGADPVTLRNVAIQDLDDSELRTLNKKLDREFRKIVEIKRGK